MVSSGLKQAAMSLVLAGAVICGYAAVALAEEAASSTSAVAPAAESAASATPAVSGSELVPPAPVIPALGLPLDKVSADLQSNFANMVHYYKIARFDLATNFAQAVLAGSPDAAMMVAMVETPDAGYSLLAEMAASDNAELADAAKKIKKLAEEGYK